MVNGSHIPPGEPQSKSLTLKCDQIDFHCGRGKMTNEEFNVDTSCALGHGNSDKGVANNIVNLHSATELNFGLYSKYYENKRTIKRVVDGIGHSNCLALQEKNLYSCKLCGMMMDMTDAQNTLNLYGKTSFISPNGPFDNGNIRSVGKPMSRTSPPSQAVPLGFPLSSSTLIGNQTLQLSNKESLNGRLIELTKNPRMQTLHHGLEFPTHAFEPEISNVSSGRSAPVVTEASAVIHDKEFSTADGQNTVASEQSAEFLGVACEFNPMDAGPSKEFTDNSSRSLLE
ncbi:hypothetical protein K7X08_016715 [Anisodus acutangulus]|uniref:Uncharacterized protein n=1 Tax=Anisodus acutangulus TaxID=402998 RepID=A0A9Q1LFR6_9SOLA|nr:hypothetical protein K7X08_016715 [Anisodus acutangulus]